MYFLLIDVVKKTGDDLQRDLSFDEMMKRVEKAKVLKSKIDSLEKSREFEATGNRQFGFRMLSNFI